MHIGLRLKNGLGTSRLILALNLPNKGFGLRDVGNGIAAAMVVTGTMNVLIMPMVYPQRQKSLLKQTLNRNLTGSARASALLVWQDPCRNQYLTVQNNIPHLRGSCLLKCAGTEELQSLDEAKTQPQEEPGTQQQHDDEVKELREELRCSERIRMEQQRAIEKDHEAFAEVRKQTRMLQEPLKGIEKIDD